MSALVLNASKVLGGAHVVGHTPTRPSVTARYHMHYFRVAYAAGSALQHFLVELCLVGQAECTNLCAICESHAGEAAELSLKHRRYFNVSLMSIMMIVLAMAMMTKITTTTTTTTITTMTTTMIKS